MEVRRIAVDDFRVWFAEKDFIRLSLIEADKVITMESALMEVIERGLIEITGEILGKET